MIYTVTLNPALDKTVEIPSFTTDGVNRITSIRTDPGGKGINVSKVVAALGSTSRVLGILGGSTGQMISEALSGLNMTCDFLPVEGNTRINLKVVDPIAHTFKLSKSLISEEITIMATSDFSAANFVFSILLFPNSLLSSRPAVSIMTQGPMGLISIGLRKRRSKLVFFSLV